VHAGRPALAPGPAVNLLYRLALRFGNVPSYLLELIFLSSYLLELIFLSSYLLELSILTSAWSGHGSLRSASISDYVMSRARIATRQKRAFLIVGPSVLE